MRNRATRFATTLMHVLQAITIAGGLMVTPACSSSSNPKPPGNPEPPAAPPGPAHLGDACREAGLSPVVIDAPGFCTGDFAGLSGCLEPDSYYNCGGEICDVWVCDAEGDQVALCACGNEAVCTDTATAAICEPF
jgi:hypothetical protein